MTLFVEMYNSRGKEGSIEYFRMLLGVDQEFGRVNFVQVESIGKLYRALFEFLVDRVFLFIDLNLPYPDNVSVGSLPQGQHN